MSDSVFVFLTFSLAAAGGIGITYFGAKAYLPRIRSRLAKERDRLKTQLRALFISDVQPRSILIWRYALTPLIGLLVLSFSASWIFAVAAFVVGYKAPGWYLEYAAKKRRERLERQVSDLIMSLETTLKANMNLAQSIQEVAERMPAPMSQEFRLIHQRRRQGQSTEKALNSADRRLKIPKLSLVFRSISVTEKRGGDLPDLLKRMGKSFKEIDRVEERIKTETSGVRLTAKLMAAMPILVCFLLYIASPNHVLMLFNTLLGNLILLVAAVFDYIGFIMIKRLGELEF